MKSCLIKMGLFVSLLLLCLIVNSCADAEEEEIKFRVKSTGDNFTGSYSVDGDNSITFEGVSKGNDTYEYTKTLEIDDMIEIDASPKYESGYSYVTMLKIIIYDTDDGGILDSVVDDDGEDNVGSVSITYETGSETDD